MTTAEILFMTGFYSAALVAVAYFTRARTRRILAALAGGAVFGIVALLAISAGESQGWWHMASSGTWGFYLLLWLGFAISCAVTYLVLWRIVRRFGNRGLVVCVLVSAMIGPPRDYLIVARFPRWMTFAPGIAPVLADSAVYALLIMVGYAVMRLVAGPAKSDA